MRVFRGAGRKGQGLSEYGLVLGLVAVVSIAALSSTGSAVSGLIGGIAGAVSAGSNPCDLDGCIQQVVSTFEAAGGHQNPAALTAAYAAVDVCYASFNSNNCDSSTLP